ncbi:hypothetical protein H0H93_016180 [Arthromyces matolae]|nr:hypothetical protein H0H93_016180 [Arthromyces matolae]
MNSYPPELLTQLAPVMFVAGLDPVPSTEQPTPATGKGNDFVILASRLRETLQAQRKVSIWQPEKMKTFQVILVDKEIRFPPRKLVPPEDATYSAAHSPLSPLTPTSPLYPDGLIAPIWIRKHTSLIPSVFVSFMRIYEYPSSNAATNPLDLPDTNREREREAEERKRDTKLAAEIAQRKKSTNEYGVKLTVVLMASRKLLGELKSVYSDPQAEQSEYDPALDARLTFIRRQSGLDSRAALFVLSPVSPGELGEFVKSLQQALYEPALEYYTNHSKRVRRKRNRHSQTNYSNPISGPSNITRPLRPEGWTVRYEYKMACFAEFRGEDEVALKHYQDAHSMLVVMFGSTAILPPRTKRWAEAKVLADCINFKICKLYLYNNEHALAISHYNSHVRIFSDFSRGWGIGEETYEYWSWIARQYRVVSELLEQGSRSTLTIPVHRPNLQILLNTNSTAGNGRNYTANGFETETLRSLGINPSHALQHAGFYYLMAAKCTETRRARFLATLELEGSQPTPSSSPGFTNERKVDHLALILELYTKAYELFKKHIVVNPHSPTQSRLTLWIAYRIAQTYYQSAKYDMAIRFFERIATIYRREGWDALLQPLLSTWYACAREVGDIELSIKLMIEMMGHSPANPEEADSLGEDLLAILKVTTSALETTYYILKGRQSTVPSTDEPLIVNIPESRPICHISASSEDQREVDAILRWEPGGCFIFSGNVSCESPTTIRIDKLVWTLAEEKWTIDVAVDFDTSRQTLSTRWLASTEPRRFLPIRPENPSSLRQDICFPASASSNSVRYRSHELDVVLSHESPAYLNEEFPITISISNIDTRPLDVIVNVLVPPTEFEGAANTIIMDDERSSNFIKGIPFGLLAPGDRAEKILYLVPSGASGDRVVDISIQSKATHSTAIEPEEDDITETTRMLVISTSDPLKATQTISYRHSLGAWPGLADLTTFDGDTWNAIRTSEALVETRLECAGPLPLQERGGMQVIDCSVDIDETLSAEYYPGDEFSYMARFALSPAEDGEDDKVIPSPGTYRVSWRRIGKNGSLGSLTSTVIPLPALHRPDEGLIALLSIPSPATLHRPIPLTLTIRNYHATRSANILVQLELDASDGFIVAGLRSGRLPILMPGTEEQFVWNLIPIECGHIRIPQIKVIDKRPTFTGVSEPTADMVSKGEVVKIVNVRLGTPSSVRATSGESSTAHGDNLGTVLMTIPDAQIFPRATGPAATLVERHQKSADLVLYAGWFCPSVQRVWIALEEKGIKYQYKEVNPYKKEKHFIGELSCLEIFTLYYTDEVCRIQILIPKALSPAVEYKGRAIYESLVICEFLEDLYPTQKPLLPVEPTSRAIARIWIDFIAKAIVPGQQRLVQAQEPGQQTQLLKEYIEVLQKFSKEIKGPYFLGEEFSLVDVAIAPWIVRDYIIRENRSFKREDVSEIWVKYGNVIETRNSIVETQSEKKHLNEIYGRYLRDEAQSETAKAVRAGRVIP